MNAPTPAIVSQDGVRRLPRWGLLLFCAIYVLAGFLWRDPWKRVDLTSFGYMLELARGQTSWWAPGLLGESAHFDALLPYWLGAWAIQLTPSGGSPFFSVRVVFAGLLVLTLLAVWYGIYYLARSPQAQPVSFAFGGEARPTDYARAIADGGLLAFLACLGLAQPSHEVSPALAQLCFSALTLYAMAALAYRYWMPALLGTLGLVGLTLSGAPSLAILFGLLEGAGSAEAHKPADTPICARPGVQGTPSNTLPIPAKASPTRTPCLPLGGEPCFRPANRAVRPDKPVFRHEIELSGPTSSLLGPTTSLSAQTLTFFGVKQRCQAKHRCCLVKQLRCQARHRCCQHKHLCFSA